MVDPARARPRSFDRAAKVTGGTNLRLLSLVLVAAQSRWCGLQTRIQLEGSDWAVPSRAT